jgi:hypothetical protein
MDAVFDQLFAGRLAILEMSCENSVSSEKPVSAGGGLDVGLSKPRDIAVR